MAVKECIKCKKVVAVAKKICDCGHVFLERKKSGFQETPVVITPERLRHSRGTLADSSRPVRIKKQKYHGDFVYNNISKTNKDSTDIIENRGNNKRSPKENQREKIEAEKDKDNNTNAKTVSQLTDKTESTGINAEKDAVNDDNQVENQENCIVNSVEPIGKKTDTKNTEIIKEKLYPRRDRTKPTKYFFVKKQNRKESSGNDTDSSNIVVNPSKISLKTTEQNNTVSTDTVNPIGKSNFTEELKGEESKKEHESENPEIDEYKLGNKCKDNKDSEDNFSEKMMTYFIPKNGGNIAAIEKKGSVSESKQHQLEQADDTVSSSVESNSTIVVRHSELKSPVRLKDCHVLTEDINAIIDVVIVRNNENLPYNNYIQDLVDEQSSECESVYTNDGTRLEVIKIPNRIKNHIKKKFDRDCTPNNDDVPLIKLRKKSQMSNDMAPFKRPVGRPRKHPVILNKIKRPVGRPRKVSKEMEETTSVKQFNSTEHARTDGDMPYAFDAEQYYRNSDFDDDDDDGDGDDETDPDYKSPKRIALEEGSIHHADRPGRRCFLSPPQMMASAKMDRIRNKMLETVEAERRKKLIKRNAFEIPTEKRELYSHILEEINRRIRSQAFPNNTSKPI